MSNAKVGACCGGTWRCGVGKCQCGGRSFTYNTNWGGLYVGPSHFTTLANEVVGLPCGGCNTPHAEPYAERHCHSCNCCGCQDLRALARAPAVVSGVGPRARRIKKPNVYTALGCSRCGTNHEHSARVSGCGCKKALVTVNQTNLGYFVRPLDNVRVYRFIGPDGKVYEGEVAGGSEQYPSLVNIRSIS